MDSREVIVSNGRSHHLQDLFTKWLYERKEFIIPFFFLFVVVDPLITFIGTSGFGMPEGNALVSIMMQAENGWWIWIGWKLLFGFVGTIFMFSAYCMINTGKLTGREKERATIVEYGAWSLIIFFLFFVILHWVTTIIQV
jgi:hypothetical protein